MEIRATTGRRRFAVEGLRCSSCLAEVLESLHDIEGVVEVGIRLRVGGRSALTVRASDRISSEVLIDAVTAAGFTVAAGTARARGARATALAASG